MLISRYYPPLVAFCTENLIIFITSTIYMWADLANNVYVEGDLRIFKVQDGILILVLVSDYLEKETAWDSRMQTPRPKSPR